MQISHRLAISRRMLREVAQGRDRYQGAPAELLMLPDLLEDFNGPIHFRIPPHIEDICQMMQNSSPSLMLKATPVSPGRSQIGHSSTGCQRDTPDFAADAIASLDNGN
ncbi:putative flavin-containing amine oxidase [Aspergillus affinis]|uniref:putative flavin-containing amine oxidase n=1 Tax=Aspergillus affinis TaxID=1070780 RepID=UPI0022FF1AEC|nr:putative flavin-containing amine oxidase [Aspergillus affinis]KAI9045142.1 putative flavin-containing amine oxidase [Aspergillus affinis]